MVRLRRDPLRLGSAELHWGVRTYVMGIINVTPDSFSGDGLTSVEAALALARQMATDGADLLDIGAESTRPETWSGPGLPEKEEIARVLPVIEAIAAELSIPISVDTYKSGVARLALAAGATLVNDVFGLRRDPEMATVVASAGVPVVLMHNGAGGAGADLMVNIRRELADSLALADRAAIDRSQVLVDPGIGFGKTREGNLEIIRRLPELQELGCPILIGPSRKSFIGKTLALPVEDRLEGTAAAVALCIAGGADVVRVHDVKAMVRVARMADAIVRAGAE